MNANYGLMPDLRGRARGPQKKIELGRRALSAMVDWIAQHEIEPPSAASASA